MVTKTIEDDRSAITADVTLCDACGNPVEEKAEYYKKSDIPNVNTAVKQQTGKVASDTIDELYEEWGKPVRDELTDMSGAVREHPVVGFELREKVDARDVMEDVDTALYDALRDAQKKTYTMPEPTLELCPDCQDGVEHNMALIESLLFEEEEPAEPTMNEQRMAGVSVAIMISSVICIFVALLLNVTIVPFAAAGLTACLILLSS